MIASMHIGCVALPALIQFLTSYAIIATAHRWCFPHFSRCPFVEVPSFFSCKGRVQRPPVLAGSSMNGQ